MTPCRNAIAPEHRTRDIAAATGDRAGHGPARRPGALVGRVLRVAIRISLVQATRKPWAGAGAPLRNQWLHIPGEVG